MPILDLLRRAACLPLLLLIGCGVTKENPTCPAAGCACSGEHCVMACADPDTCGLECSDAADCELDCHGADTCHANCLERGDCYVDCSTSTTCTVDCALGSHCECDGESCVMTCEEEGLTCQEGPCECG